MHIYVPSNLPRRPGLVVVLHGCDQTVQSYDRGSGWSRLAERDGFVVLYPEQKAANNAKCCFSWFLPGDVTRGQGEVRSIIQMIEQVSADHNVDQSRIFVTGLSAGGAMTAALLATYPEKFAGGAIIGAIPYGSAHSVQEAFECMFSDRETAPRILGDRVRAASEHRGPWPRLSIWHGSDDPIVRPSNAEECVRQWTNVHGLTAEASRFERIGRHTRRVWKDSKGRERLEAFTLAGMGHGIPVNSGAGHATTTPFFLDVGLSSTHRIAEFWGLIDLAMADGATVASAAPRSRRIITVG
jgi:poly(hydroxyalkanoate) depolymerase family esterase